jgi:hypothetical protein
MRALKINRKMHQPIGNDPRQVCLKGMNPGFRWMVGMRLCQTVMENIQLNFL